MVLSGSEFVMRVSFAIILAVSTTPAIADFHYSGRVTAVSDGDTFTIMDDQKPVRVRLCGIDSPERGQPGYGKAAGAMAALVEGKEVTCIQVGGGTPCDGRSRSTNRDRIVAQCFVGKADVSMEMVCNRAAVDWPKFSGGYYAKCKR